MEREPAIRRLTIRNLLSFGEKGTTVDLQNLNVLIGANGSGKSNLIEVVGLLQNAPKDLGKAISNGGSIDEWLWKGSPTTQPAHIEAVSSPADGSGALRYILMFTKVGFRFEIVAEGINDSEGLRPEKIFYSNLPNSPPRSTIRAKGARSGKGISIPGCPFSRSEKIQTTILKSHISAIFLRNSGYTATGNLGLSRL